MAALLGDIVGGVIGIFLLAALWEFVVFRRVLNDPLKSKVCSVLAAYFLGSTIKGFADANEGPFVWGAFLQYLIPAFFVGVFARIQSAKL